jgi:hypothetical protein
MSTKNFCDRCGKEIIGYRYLSVSAELSYKKINIIKKKEQEERAEDHLYATYCAECQTNIINEIHAILDHK